MRITTTKEKKNEKITKTTNETYKAIDIKEAQTD